VPNKGSDSTYFFSFASMKYVRGCCAVLEGLSPPNDVAVATVAKRFLDFGLADVCLTETLNQSSCMLALLQAACSRISNYILARVSALVSCSLLYPKEVAQLLTLDGGAIGELDASTSAYSIKQFPLQVVNDVLGYLSVLGVARMVDDAGGVVVVPLHLRPLLLKWAASHGYSELDAFTLIGTTLHRSAHDTPDS
jgi:hypothetical protein